MKQSLLVTIMHIPSLKKLLLILFIELLYYSVVFNIYVLLLISALKQRLVIYIFPGMFHFNIVLFTKYKRALQRCYRQ